MMSMADGGGSAAGQQVLNYLIIWNVLMLVGFFADNHLTPGGPGCDTKCLERRSFSKAGIQCHRQQVTRELVFFSFIIATMTCELPSNSFYN